FVMTRFFASICIVFFAMSSWAVTSKPKAAAPEVKLSTAVKKPAPVKKKLKVVTTLSVLKALAKEVGGTLIEVSSLSSATEDPHFVKAKPTFKRLVGEADLFIQIGRSLELWVPQVLASAGNSKL